MATICPCQNVGTILKLYTLIILPPCIMLTAWVTFSVTNWCHISLQNLCVLYLATNIYKVKLGVNWMLNTVLSPCKTLCVLYLAINIYKVKLGVNLVLNTVLSPYKTLILHLQGKTTLWCTYLLYSRGVPRREGVGKYNGSCICCSQLIYFIWNSFLLWTTRSNLLQSVGSFQPLPRVLDCCQICSSPS